MVQGINGSSGYIQRLQQMQMMRAQTGKFGDIRDIPMFTAQGRAMEQQKMWEQMGGQGSFIEAQYMAEADQKQLNMASISSAINGLGTLAKNIVDIVNIFKT